MIPYHWAVNNGKLMVQIGGLGPGGLGLESGALKYPQVTTPFITIPFKKDLPWAAQVFRQHMAQMLRMYKYWFLKTHWKPTTSGGC